MLAYFLGKSNPINYILLLGLFFCFFLLAAYFNFFLEGFTLEKLLISFSFALIFLSIFFFYNFITRKNGLTFDNSYAFFLFTISLLFLLRHFLEYRILLLFLIHLFFLRKIYSFKSKKSIIQKLFDTGFWLGATFLIEPFTFVYFVLLYAAVYKYQKITIHTLLVPIIGFITPLFLYLAYCFWFDKIADFDQLFAFNVSKSTFFYSKREFIWFFNSMLLLAFIGAVLKLPKALAVNNSFKKNWILQIINTFVAISFILLIPEKNGSEMVFLIFPATLIIANGVEVIKSNLIKNMIFGALLTGAIFYQFVPFLF